MTDRTRRGDSVGKRALFETPPIEIDDTLKDDPLIHRDEAVGHEALYSVGDRQPGTAVMTCSVCEVRSRISLVEMLVRILSISVWVPMRTYSRWMPCPSCQQRTWCRIEWLS